MKDNKNTEQLDLLESASGDDVIEFEADDLVPQVEDQDDHSEDERSEPQKPTRAEKRIRDLVADKKKLEKELDDIKTKMKKSEETSKKTVSGLQVSKAESDVTSAQDKVDSAKKSVREAVASGDDDAVAQAYENLATAVNMRTVAQQWLEYVKEAPEDDPEPTDQDDKSSPPQKSDEPRELSPLEKAFIKNNGSWFKKDFAMTGTIQGVHAALVEQGYSPDDFDDSEMGHHAYWEEVDRQMSEIFGDKYKKVVKGSGKKAPTVTPPSGSPNVSMKGGKTQIRLTPDQLEIAKRLGVPPKRYAEEIAKKQRKA